MTPYFETENGKLYHGDCLEILPELESVDLVLTDPPYGIDFPYFEYKDNRDNLRFLITGLFDSQQKAKRMVILSGPTQIQEYPPCDWIGAVTWNTTGSFGKYGYSQWTPVLLYGKDVKGFGNVNGVTKTDVLHINGGGSVGFQRDALQKQHTCPKPLNIMQWCVLRFSEDQDVICDPFFGSGTTGVACEELNRKWIGIEISEKYCEIAARRIEHETQQLRLFR